MTSARILREVCPSKFPQAMSENGKFPYGTTNLETLTFVPVQAFTGLMNSLSVARAQQEGRADAGGALTLQDGQSGWSWVQIAEHRRRAEPQQQPSKTSPAG